MSERVLLVGGNGFIGSHLVDRCLANGYQVRVLDQFPERFRKPLQDVEYVLADYSDTGVLQKALSGCDILIHLAHVGTPATSASQADQEVLRSITAFVRMLEWLKGGMVKQFVFFSSGGAVYGVPDRLPVEEEFKGWPVSPYGVAKLSMEHYLHMFSIQNDLPYMILRPSNPYGPRQSYTGSQGVIPIFMHRILTGQAIQIWGAGTNRKDYIYIDDLSSAVLSLMQSDQSNEIFNIGSGQGVSLNEIIAAIENTCEVKGDVTYTPARQQDVADIILSSEKIFSATGWDPSVSLTQGVCALHNWMNAILEG